MLSLPGGIWAADGDSDLIESLPGGGVNWSTGIVFAEGEGFVPERYQGQARGLAMARRAATVDAYRNLLEISQGVRIDSRTIVRDLVVEDDTVVAELNGVILGATTHLTWQDDESVRVRAEIPIDGEFASIVLPRAGITDDLAPGARRTPIRFPSFVSQAWATVPVLPHVSCAGRDPGKFSGLIIDARHLPGLSPAITPRLWLSSGAVAYPSERARPSPSSVRVATYDVDEGVACGRPRVRESPAVIEASAIHRTLKSDLVIEEADWEAVKNHADIFSAAKVLILIRAIH